MKRIKRGICMQQIDSKDLYTDVKHEKLSSANVKCSIV